MRTRLLAALGAAALVVAHDLALTKHRKRLDELESRADNAARGLQTERRMLDAINHDFDQLLVVTVPVALKARAWVQLLDERPGVVAARADLQAWLADAREAQQRREAGE